MKSKIMKFFSDLGRSLMMPVAALAACGIILGITSALLKTQVQDAVPFLTASVPLFIITTLNKVSGIVFTLLPVLFAISIAFGLAKEDKGVAAFAGFIGYYTFLVASSCMISTGIMDFSAMKISNILGVDTVDMGALAGIMAGLVTAKLHNKYHKVQFPAAIAFYGGKRFVALVVLVSMTVIGLVMPLIWAPISVGIDGLGRIIRSSGAFGVFIFGTLERLLIPTGLHHVLNSLFRTTAIGGTYHGVEGCLNIFLQFLDQAPLSDMKPYTQFLGQGKMPYMLFGLPAAALAIYRTTPQDKKAKVKALMIAGVAACFVSGITEPLEFSFMFIAPALFVFHAIMGGISFMLMSLLGVIVGNTGGGFIDFLLWGVFQPGSHWYWVIVVGIPYAFIYYVKNDEGGREKRIITTGESDENYTQVTEGLKEGELVYYNSTDQVPTKYSKYTVTRSDFDIANYGVRYSRSDAGTITETCDYEGQIVSVNVKQDDTVEKGMLLYVVDTGEGKAAITEAKNAIDSENESYAQKIADYDKQIKDLSEGGSSAEENNRQDEKPDTAYDEQQLKLNLQLLNLQKKLACADHTYQLSRLQSAYDSISAGNDGKGNISVYAKNDGKVSKVSVKAGDNVEEGSDILQITGNSTDVLLVQVKDSNSYKVYKDNIADVGERVSLELDGTTIYGSCIGFAGYGSVAQKGYINQDDKGVHITGNTDSGYGNAAFYIKLDNGIPDDLTRASAVKFSYVSFKKVVVVPTSIIHKQINPMDKDDISYYVWKIDGDSVVKQPVILSDYTSGSNTLVLYGIDEGDEICLAS